MAAARPSSLRCARVVAAGRPRPLVCRRSLCSAASPQHVDVAIVGGGIVGSALAAALAANPWTKALRVALLEQEPPPLFAQVAERKEPGLRVSAINIHSARVLHDARAWSTVKAARATPFEEMQVWDSFGSGRLHWTASEPQDRFIAEGSPEGVEPPLARWPTHVHPTPALGFIVENDLLTAALHHVLQASCPQVSVLTGRKLEAVENVRASATPLDRARPAAAAAAAAAAAPAEAPPGGDWAVLRLSGGTELRARLVVGADGPNSLVKRAAGLDSTGASYGQIGVVATVRLAQHSATAWQRFLPEGPLALLPCHDNFASIVWSTSPAHARRLLAASPAQLAADLNAAFRLEPAAFRGGQRSVFEQPLPAPLAELLPVLFPPPAAPLPPPVEAVVGRPGAFPLRSAHAGAYVRPRVALAGDAAHVVHPMAGQGANLGLADVGALVGALADAAAAGEDIGALAVLRRYEAQRRLANAAALAGLEALHRLFGARDGPLALMRNVGMDVFRAVPALRHAAARAAMGVDYF